MPGPSDVRVRNSLRRTFFAERKSFEDMNYIRYNTFLQASRSAPIKNSLATNGKLGPITVIRMDPCLNLLPTIKINLLRYSTQ